MHKVFLTFFLFTTLVRVEAQELNAQFVVNADLVNQTNQQKRNGHALTSHQ